MTPIYWRENAPYSPQFDDIYFSPTDGLAEARHVFLGGNRLNERFANCRDFTIAELGFGTGLNCLAAWELFLRTAPADAHLHIISFERYPMAVEAMREAVGRWEELSELADSLYTPLLSSLRMRWEEALPFSACNGFFIRTHNSRLTLTLIIGDAREALPAMDFQADAWFLDGFAPAKNPEMWQEELLKEVGRRTAPGGTAATFTVAGAVRRGLQAAGFSVEKASGYGRKKEMTRATMHPAPVTGAPTNTLIIGGGIAGCSAAAALARRGVAVTLLEAAETLAAGATGNPAGALYPRLSKHWSPAMRLYWDALRFMRPDAPCGMLKLPVSDEEEAKLQAMPESLGLPPAAMQWLEVDAASERAGLPLPTGALWLPSAAIVSGSALCEVMLQSITHHTQADVTAIERVGDRWRAITASGEWYEADCLILANAAHMLRYPQAAHLPLRWDRGQLTFATAITSPRCILSHKGYALPLPDGRVLIGATHGRGETDCGLREADHAENIALTRRYVPDLLPDDAMVMGGRAALRCNAPDHLPIVGALVPGLYVSTGHGSRGLLSAPFAGEILADLILGAPPPTDSDVLATIAPLRFSSRQA